MKNCPKLLLALLVCCTFLSSCRAKRALPGAENTEIMTAPMIAPSKPMKNTPNAEMPLVVTARASKQQFLGKEAVELQIEVKNTSQKMLALQFNSGQSFDFSATPVGKTEPIWSWGMNKRFMQALRTVELESGKSLPFTATWMGAAPGTYTMVGTITANGGLKAEPFQVVIQ